MDLGAALVAHQRLGHPEGGDKARWTVRTDAGLERATQTRPFRCGGLLTSVFAPACRITIWSVIGEAVHPFERLGARFFKTRRAFIRRLHRSRRVEDYDAEFRGLCPGLEKWPRERQHCQSEQDDLQYQQPILAQLLKRSARLGLGQEFLQSNVLETSFTTPLRLRRVKQDDDRNRRGKGERCWSEESSSSAGGECGVRNDHASTRSKQQDRFMTSARLSSGIDGRNSDCG